jgi:four helix bundle protein
VKGSVKKSVKKSVKRSVKTGGALGYAKKRHTTHKSDDTPRPSLADHARMAQFRVLEVARAVADEINGLLRNRKLRLIHRAQLRNAAQSIPANIREGMGRKHGPERSQAYRHAHGSAEEADEHLRANFADERIAEGTYHRLHNRIALIVKMLDKNIA